MVVLFIQSRHRTQTVIPGPLQEGPESSSGGNFLSSSSNGLRQPVCLRIKSNEHVFHERVKVHRNITKMNGESSKHRVTAVQLVSGSPF